MALFVVMDFGSLPHEKWITTPTNRQQSEVHTGMVIVSSETSTEICIRDPQVRFFMYHYIRDDDTRDTHGTRELSIPPNLFEGQMQAIHRLESAGLVTLMRGKDFVKAVRSGCYPGRNIWIFTDDDGWIDSYTNLYPIAKKYHIPFFFWVIGNRLDISGFISRVQVREISDDPLFTISSHSLTHSDESRMDVKKEENEMCESKKILESTIGTTVDTYIYPSGRIGTGSVENLKKCGYTLGWSTQFGKTFDLAWANNGKINRIRIGRETKPEYFESLLIH